MAAGWAASGSWRCYLRAVSRCCSLTAGSCPSQRPLTGARPRCRLTRGFCCRYREVVLLREGDVCCRCCGGWGPVAWVWHLLQVLCGGERRSCCMCLASAAGVVGGSCCMCVTSASGVVWGSCCMCVASAAGVVRGSCCVWVASAACAGRSCSM